MAGLSTFNKAWNRIRSTATDIIKSDFGRDAQRIAYAGGAKTLGGSMRGMGMAAGGGAVAGGTYGAFADDQSIVGGALSGGMYGAGLLAGGVAAKGLWRTGNIAARKADIKAGRQRMKNVGNRYSTLARKNANGEDILNPGNWAHRSK